MSTTTFLRIAPASAHRGTNTANLAGAASGWIAKLLSPTAGTTLVAHSTATVGGATLGIEVTEGIGGLPFEFLSEPVDQDFTMSGTITANLWASESSMNANVAINVVIDKVAALNGAITNVVKSTRVTEVAVTTRAVNNFTTGMTAADYTDVSFLKGDRIRVRVFGDDAGTMGSGFNFSLGFDDDVGGADGDSFITFTETFGFITTTPTGSTLYLKNNEPGEGFVQDTGWVVPGAFSSADNGGGAAWASPSNAASSDDVYTTSVTTPTLPTDYLYGKQLGLALPAGAVPFALEAEIEGKVDAGTDFADVVFVGADGTTALSQTLSLPLGTAESVATILFSSEYFTQILTEAIVEDVDFGVRISFPSGSDIAISIDRVRVKVYYTLGNGQPYEMWTARGNGGAANIGCDTVAGWATPVQFKRSSSGDPGQLLVEWYSKTVEAFTLGSLVLANIRAFVSNAGANASLKAEIAVCDSDGGNASTWGIANIEALTTNGSVGEIGTSDGAYEAWISGDDVSVTAGKRIRLRLYLDDCGNTSMISGHNAQISFDGTTGGAAGDSFITFTQTITEQSLVTVPPPPIIVPSPAVTRASRW